MVEEDLDKLEDVDPPDDEIAIETSAPRRRTLIIIGVVVVAGLMVLSLVLWMMKRSEVEESKEKVVVSVKVAKAEKDAIAKESFQVCVPKTYIAANRCNRAFASFHPNIMNFLMADGHVKTITRYVDAMTYLALATIRGGEVVSADAF